MKFTEIERLQLEAMDYTLAVDAQDEEVATFACGSISNYRKEVIYAGWQCKWDSDDDDVYYLCLFGEHSEAGEPSDRHVEGRKYVNIGEMYKQYKLAEEALRVEREKWEEIRKKARERRRG